MIQDMMSSLQMFSSVVDFSNLTNPIPAVLISPWSLLSSIFPHNTTTATTILAPTPNLPISIIPSRLFVLLGTLALYGLIFGFHVRFTAPVYNKHQQHGRQRLIANINFSLHIVSAVTEVIRWQLRACWDLAPKPTYLDFAIALVQIFTSLRIAKYIRRGRSIMTRPTFQAGAVLRLVLASAAWLTGSAWLYKSEVTSLNGFIYTRLALLFLGPLLISKHGEKPRPPDVYNLAIYTAAVIAMAEVDIPHAPKIYSSFVVLVASLNRWVTDEMAKKDLWLVKKAVLDVLAACGFAELETIDRMSGPAAGKAVDEWIDGALRMSESDAVESVPEVKAKGGQ